jgi:hypothetical protein
MAAMARCCFAVVPIAQLFELVAAVVLGMIARLDSPWIRN